MIRIIVGDCRKSLARLPDKSVQCVVTSPPYFGLRDYDVEGQLGLEMTPAEYVENMVSVFAEVHRILKDDGTLWLNLGDSYSSGGNGGGAMGSKQTTNVGANMPPKKTPGYKSKQLLGMPWRVAIALQDAGWYLRQDIIWNKPNAMPESVTDRCVKAHEYLFLLAKSQKYYFDHNAIREPVSNPGDKSGNKDRKQRPNADVLQAGNQAGAVPWTDVDGLRNKRSVWHVVTRPLKEAHFATFPPDLIVPCVSAGCPAGGLMLDPFMGAGTTGLVSQRLGRSCVGLELNPAYAQIAMDRINGEFPGACATLNLPTAQAA